VTASATRRADDLGLRYDAIGRGYADTRREDPHLRALIDQALGDAGTVVNVGAGTGSYEPTGRHVIAIEPSDVMAQQRPPGRVPAIRATAGRLPLRDRSVDAAMTVLSLHHWDLEQEAGVRELRRVARGPVVIATFDPQVSAEMWLPRDYLPEVAELDRRIFPPPARLADWLGGDVQSTVIPIAADSPDWTFAAFWAHPERVLDPAARAATSGFARMPAEVVTRVLWEVARDLNFGVWDERHGDLRRLAEYDAGFRLLVAREPR
jgi:SAM-dependent methyltransferase